jgi:hypothetical protein
MEQRRLRLGDILDDYCPRERRVTNHAVVAMIEEDVKQTRCTTCDAEHAYKGARVPKRRKKETPAALYKEVLAGLSEAEGSPVLAAAPALAAPVIAPAEAASSVRAVTVVPPSESVLVNSEAEEFDAPMHSDDHDHRDEYDEPRSRVDDDGGDAPAADGPVHRPLIRATLPRPEGQKDARPVPDFTVRHAPPRANGHGGFRGERMRMRAGNGHGTGNSQREANGNRAQGSGQRFHGNRPSGGGRQPIGRGGAQSGFRGNAGPNGKRGRGSRG